MIKSSPEEPTITVFGDCHLCGKTSRVIVPTRVYNKWMDDPSIKIQDVWPESTPGQRETLISGSHEECFDKTFGEDD